MKDYCISHLAYAAAIQQDDKVWVSNWRFNGLFSIKDEVVKYEGRFKGYPDTFVACHSLVKSHGDVLYFFPQNSNAVDMYNIKNKKFSKTIIKEWDSFQRKIVIGVVEWENGFWLFPRYGGMSIIKMNYRGEVEEEYLLKSLKEIGKESEKEILALSICNISDEDVYIPIHNTNAILYINLKTKKERVIQIKNATRIYTMAYDGNYFFVSNGKNVICCRKDFQVIKEYKNIIEGSSNIKNDIDADIEKILFEKDVVWVIPTWYGTIGKINKKSHKIERLEILENNCKIIKDRISSWRTFKEAVVSESHVIIYPMSLDCQIEIFEESVEYKRYIVPKESIPTMDICEKPILQEQSADDLEFFINGIRVLEERRSKSEKEIDSCGKRIFREYICSTK